MCFCVFLSIPRAAFCLSNVIIDSSSRERQSFIKPSLLWKQKPKTNQMKPNQTLPFSPFFILWWKCCQRLLFLKSVCLPCPWSSIQDITRSNNHHFLLYHNVLSVVGFPIFFWEIFQFLEKIYSFPCVISCGNGCMEFFFPKHIAWYLSA